MKDRTIIQYTLIAQIAILLILVIMFVNSVKFRRFNYKKSEMNNNGQCSKDTCGAIDNVNDPAYNMENIVKQSILLEEHIAEKNKYCLSCIVKHFQHILGLAEEALWMAGKDVNKYPYLKESEEFYQGLFDSWVSNRNNDDVKVEVLNKLREKRRQLIDTYFLK